MEAWDGAALGASALRWPTSPFVQDWKISWDVRLSVLKPGQNHHGWSPGVRQRYNFLRNRMWTLETLSSRESSWKDSHSKGAAGRARDPNRKVNNHMPGLHGSHKQPDWEALSVQRTARRASRGPLQGNPKTGHHGWAGTARLTEVPVLSQLRTVLSSSSSLWRTLGCPDTGWRA